MALTQASEGGLKISNAGTNGQYLQKQSGNTGGLTWADVPAGVGGATGLDLNDDVKIRVGTDNDLEIYHSGTHSFIKDTGTGNLQMWTNQLSLLDSGGTESMIQAVENGAVELYHNNVKKLETASHGVEVTGKLTFSGDGNSNGIELGADADLNLYHDNSNAYIDNNVGDFYIRNDGSSTSEKIRIQAKGGEESIIATADGAVELYHNNVKRLETTAAGVTIPQQLIVSNSALFDGDIKFEGNDGTVNSMWWDKSDTALEFLDNSKAIFGTGNDLQIYHNGTDSLIVNNTGILKFAASTGGIELNTADGHAGLHVHDNGNVELYYNNAKKFETTNTGIDITGHADPAADNTHDLGDSSKRWRDLYATGVYLGGTGSANHLDDYEEGTYTPALTAGNGTFTHTTQQGTYVKIGKLVFCTFRCDWSSTNATAQMYVSTPFTSQSGNEFGQTGTGGVSYNGSFQDAYSLTIGMLGANTIAKFYARQDDDNTNDPNPVTGSGRCDGWLMFYT